MPNSLPSLSKGIGKRCIVCGNLIPKEAVKCTVCGSFQDWRRYLGFSTTALALLTALVSVIVSSAPALKALFGAHNSKLALAFQSDDGQGGVLFLVSNDGDRPGGIGEINLIVPINNEDHSYQGRVDDRVSDTLVAPQQNKQIRVMFDLGPSIVQPSAAELTGNCKISITAAEFSGEPDHFLFSKPCKTLSMVVVTPSMR